MTPAGRPADAADRLRVGIVGCGGIGNSHARAYLANPRVELVGVVDVIPERAETYARDYATTAYGSIAELADQQPDLVSVATPPGSHVGPTLELLQRGRSVLLEKPPTANLVDLDTLIAADEASSGTVYGVFQHRHGSGARRAHQLLGEGALGRPQVAVCETLWYRPDSYFLPDWRGNWAGEGGGPTLGHGIHQIDLLLHLMGPWTSVRAQSSRLARPVEFEDVSLAMITFASGAVGTIVTSLLSPRELSRIRIDTTAGTLEVDHLYGYRDADWSWSPAPDASTAVRNGRDPGERTIRRSDRSGRRRVGRQRIRRRAQQPRRPDQPAGRRPAGRPSARDDPARRPAHDGARHRAVRVLAERRDGAPPRSRPGASRTTRVWTVACRPTPSPRGWSAA